MDQSEYVRRVAERNVAEQDATHFEPRIFYDRFVFDGATERVFSNLDVFRNAEKYPVRITHIVAAMRYDASGDGPQSGGPVFGDERAIQRYGLRIRAHGTYYQNAQLTPLPLLANVPLATSDVVTRALSSWQLPKPIILGNRDNFQIEVALISAVAGEEQRVAVTLEGVGLYSRQPKRLGSSKLIDDTDIHTLDVDDFRNDGTEPFEVTQITVHHTPSVDQANPVGNVRNVRVRMRVNGNGTGEWWVTGRTGGTAVDALADASLWGLTCGRAVVHKLPGAGWLWYPNEGVTPEVHSFDPVRADTVLVAMIGYMMLL